MELLRPGLSAICARRVLHPQRLRLRSVSTAVGRNTQSRFTPLVKPPAEEPTSKPSTALLTLQPQTLHQYTDLIPPTEEQLNYANRFFAASNPKLLWTEAYFRQFPASPHPEIAFLGRSNVGKSSLLNAVFGRPDSRVAHVSKKPGRTRTMNAFAAGGERFTIAEDTPKWKLMGRGGVVVVDMPGYGKGSRAQWGTEILKYIENRKQLRRTYLLVDAEHGLKSADIQLLEHFRDKGISHQIILSKVDKLLYPRSKQPGPESLSNKLMDLRSLCEDIRKTVQPEDWRGPKALGDILCCSSEKEITGHGLGRGKLGIDALRWAVLGAAGLDCDAHGNPKQAEQYQILEEEEKEEEEKEEEGEQ